MATDDAEIEALMRLIFQQPDWEHLQQVLADHVDDLTESFFEYLQSITLNTLDGGDLEGATSASQIGQLAAELKGAPLYLAQFHQLEAMAAERAGQIDEAVRLYRMTAEEADREADAENERAIWTFVSAGTGFVNLELQRQNYEAARQHLLYMRQRCHQLGNLTGEMTAILNLASLYYQQKILDEARSYALLAIQMYEMLRSDQVYTPPPPDKEAAANILFHLSSDFYYEREDFQAAAELAQHAINLSPQQEGGYYVLGISQSQLGQHDDAVTTWERAIGLNPTRPFYFANYAGALSQTGRPQEAIQAMSKAIELRPDDVTYYMNRGQLYQSQDQHREAIADFSQAISLAEEMMAQETAPAAAPRSQLEYDREMPARDRMDFAILHRIQSFQALGQFDQALRDIAYLIETGDETAKAGAYMLQGDLFKTNEQLPEALEAYTAALDHMPGMTSARQSRADLYLSLDYFDEALQDLAHLARRDQSPEAAIEGLTQILERQPNNLVIYKWRGYAYWESWYPSQAVADLDRYLESGRTDPEAFLWRGLAGIAYSPHPEEEEWNESFDLRRVVRSIGDLAMAAKLAPDDEQAVAAYKWLVDRAATDDQMLEWLMFTGETEAGLFQILPEAREPLKQYFIAADHSRKRDWKRSIETLKRAQARLVEAGLPVLASHFHLMIADNYLRLYELQLVLDHLDEMEEGNYLRGVPLTDHLRPAMDEMKAKRRERFGTGVVGLEIDYMNVYSIGYWAEQFGRDLIKAQAYSRIGDHDQALATLEEYAPELEDIELALQRGISFRALIQIVQVMRDAGQYERAIDILQKLEPQIDADDERKMDYYATAGTIMQLAGLHDQAQEYFEYAREIVEERGDEATLDSDLQLAGSTFYAGQPQESLALLQSIDIERVALSDNHRYYYYLIQSQALQALGRDAEAQQAILQALAIADETRSELMLFDARMSWQARQEWLYHTGVLVANKRGDYQTAVQLAERARARAFLDQLATVSLPVPESSRQLQGYANNLREVRSLLVLLRESVADEFLDLETLARLKELDSGIDILEETEERVPRLSAAKLAEEVEKVDRLLARLREEMEETQLASYTVSSETVSTYAGLRELLAVQEEG